MKDFKMSNEMYDLLKWIAEIALPALATLYLTLGGIWGLPYPKEIGATITAVDAFLGMLLGISNANYKKELG